MTKINHDRLFKELITTFFVGFLELFFPEVGAFREKPLQPNLENKIIPF